MRVGICGSRDYNDKVGGIFALIKRLNDQFGESLVIVHGAARGADTIAEIAAKKLEVNYMGFPARWGKYGLGAGPIRNALVVDACDILYAFHTNRARSKGTDNAVKQAIAAGKPVIEYDQRTEQTFTHNFTGDSPTNITVGV